MRVEVWHGKSCGLAKSNDVLKSSVKKIDHSQITTKMSVGCERDLVGRSLVFHQGVRVLVRVKENSIYLVGVKWSSINMLFSNVNENS